MGQFSVNENMLEKARRILLDQSKVYWVIGGSCAGKSTVCRAISAEYSVPTYDVDAHIFEDYPSRCTEQRHPALKAWFSVSDPFAWMLGLSEEDFQDFNRASTAEYMDLISDDLAGIGLDKGMLVDGGISSAAVLAQVVAANRVVCLKTSEASSVKIWEQSAERRFMKEMVFRLPDPENAWRKFLRLDSLMTRTIMEECEASGIRVFARDEDTDVKEFIQHIWSYLERDGRPNPIRVSRRRDNEPCKDRTGVVG